MKNVIHIYGASGSGTTTLGKKICAELGYTFMDTDNYYWMPTDPPYTTKRSKEERLQLMKNDIEKSENVVISGSLANWGNELIPFFTLAIRITTDTGVRIERIKKREYKKFGNRILAGGDMHKHHVAFLEWAAKYDTGDISMRSKAKHDEWQKLLTCPRLVLDGAAELEVNFKLVKERIKFEKVEHQVKQKIREVFAGEYSGHDYWHSIRVYHNAQMIAKTQRCNELVVMLASLLHDVDDSKLFETENYSNARSIMQDCGINKETIEAVIEVISTVSYKGTDTVVPATIEGKIVQDADRLDAIGAIGIARAFAFGGNRNRVMHNPEEVPRLDLGENEYKNYHGTTVNHFYEKLFLLKALMNTETARKIAEERDCFMHRFIDEFMEEWSGSVDLK